MITIAKSQKKLKPGELPAHRIPVYDHEGHMRGHVTRAGTEATVARFLGRHGAKLGSKGGRPAWIGDMPPPPKPVMPVKPEKPAAPTPQIVIKAEQAPKHAMGSAKKPAKKS